MANPTRNDAPTMSTTAIRSGDFTGLRSAGTTAAIGVENLTASCSAFRATR